MSRSGGGNGRTLQKPLINVTRQSADMYEELWEAQEQLEKIPGDMNKGARNHWREVKKMETLSSTRV